MHDAQQVRHDLESLAARLGARVVGHLQRAAFVEPHDDVVDVHAAGALLERRVRGAANQLARDRRAADELALVLELDLARDRRQRGVDVGDARHDLRVAR